MARRNDDRGKKKCLLEKRTLFYADESSVLPGGTVQKAYAPKGLQPKIEGKQVRKSVSIVGAVSVKGQFITKTRTEASNGQSIVYFLEYLARQIKGKICIIWDNASIHQCQLVKEFLETKTGKRFWLYNQPPYSPEVNPIENIWGYLKATHLTNLNPKNVTELREIVEDAITKVKDLPEKLAQFFHKKEVAYY